MEEQHLHRPLLSLTRTISGSTSAAASNASTSSIVQRLLLIIFTGVISVWANNEASKGFVIRVVNDMKSTPVGDKFYLFYVSNDEATRLVQNAATFATRIFYADANNMPKKMIDQVDIQFAGHDMGRDYVTVTRSSCEKNKYVLSISPLIMDFSDFRHRIRKEIQRCVAEMLLYDERGRTPRTVINGMVEYVSSRAAFAGLKPKPELRSRSFSGKCWEDEDPEVVAQFLGYWEEKSKGFIGRFYQATTGRDDWDEHNTVDKTLGMTATSLCISYHKSIVKKENLVALTSASNYR